VRRDLAEAPRDDRDLARLAARVGLVVLGIVSDQNIEK
jgi:hypothetical protein